MILIFVVYSVLDKLKYDVVLITKCVQYLRVWPFKSGIYNLIIKFSSGNPAIYKYKFIDNTPNINFKRKIRYPYQCT